MQQYTLEELAYEYFMVKHMELARQEQVEGEADKIEEEKWKEAEAWADEMEAMEEAENSPKNVDPNDPLSNPDNAEWVKKHLAEAEAAMKREKEVLGEEFGEDLNIKFDDE